MKKWVSALIAVVLVFQLSPLAFAADSGPAAATVQSAAGLAISPAAADVRLGGSITLEATILPGGTAAQNVLWASDNTAVATVSTAGVVAGLQVGFATITTTASDGSGQSATCKIAVKPVATGVALNKKKATVSKGKTLQLRATITPANAYDQTITWASSAENIAAVSSTGEVTAKKTGKATITATHADSGQNATCKITVAPAVKKVKLNSTKATVGLGRTYKLKTTLTPKNAANKKITWTSSNTKVATVSSTGVVKTKKLGKTKITALNKDSGKKAVCTITVKKRNMQEEISRILALHPNGTYFGKCGAFASYVLYELFGAYPGFPTSNVYGGQYVPTKQIGEAAQGKEQIIALLNQAKPGDLIYAHPLVANKIEHYAIYLGHDSNYLYLYEANWDNKGGVRYNAPQTYNWYTDSREVYLYRAKDYKKFYG